MATSKKVLFDSDSDSDSSSPSSSSSSDNKEKASREKKKKESKGVSFSINTKFAKEYQSRKQREELAKERELYGNSGSSSDETSSSEDEDGDLLTAKLDVDILKTINALRTKDGKIYDSSVRFFKGSDEESSDDDENENTKKKKTKPKRFKDVLREQTLEQMKEEEEGEDGAKKKAREKTSRLEYDEEQQELRKAFMNENDDSDDSDGDDDLLVIKKRHNNTEDDSETKKQYDEELKNLEASLGHSSSSADTKRQLVDPRGEVEDGEKFLLNFIKNKTWIDKSEADFDDGDSDEASLQDLEKSDDFEARYNFRFEEAAGGSGADHSIQGYARSQTMNTLRRKDETRRDKRLARKERKAAERKAKEEKLRRLKNAKREEMEEKMKQVKAVLGATAADKEGSEVLEGLKDAPIDETAIMKLLEGDFDPDKFEKSMQAAFGDEFYDKEDTEWKTDEDVQEALMKDGEVEYMDAEDKEDLDNPQPQSSETHDEQEEEYDEEEEYDGDAEEETELEKKVRAKMMDKLYELDYEDIVGGMPTRFTYREVEANSYGLSTHEILLARDSTLKQFVSLKKMAPYREGEEYHVTSRKRRKFREMLQQDIEDAEKRMKEQGTTINDNHGNDKDESGETKKKKRRRMKKGSAKDKDPKAKNEGEANENETQDLEKGTDGAAEGKKKRRRKKKGKKISNAAGESNEEKPAPKPTDTHVEIAKKPTEEASMKEVKKAEKKKRKKNKKKGSVEGVSAARLASYDL